MHACFGRRRCAGRSGDGDIGIAGSLKRLDGSLPKPPYPKTHCTVGLISQLAQEVNW